MIGKRLKIANRVARKRFNRGIWGTCNIGDFRKNNTVCSCEMCCNPRRCGWSSGTAKLTVQERKAPTVEEFDIEPEDIWFDDHYCDSYTDDYDWEEYIKDLEWMMIQEMHESPPYFSKTVDKHFWDLA